MFLLKKILAPKSNETTLVDAVSTFEVRWRSRYGEWQSSTQPEVEVFPNKQAAEAFKLSLENAFALIRHTSGTEVTIRQSKCS